MPGINYDLIAQIILAVSFLGLGIMFFRKVPLLLVFPEKEEPQKSLSLKLKENISALNPFRNFSYDVFLQKLLTKIRILSLRTDHQTFNLLKKLREKTQKKKLENDNYWDEVKKVKDEK